MLDETTAHEIHARTDGPRVLVSLASLEAALGFVAKPEGLCKGDVCIPVREGDGLLEGDAVDPVALASALGRPAVAEPEHGVVAIGGSASDRAAFLRDGLAPDFTLPDLSGRPHSLREHRGRKVVLAAYASW